MNHSARQALMQLIEQAAANGHAPAAEDGAPTPPARALAPTEDLLSSRDSRPQRPDLLSPRGAQPLRTVLELRPRAAVQLTVDTTVAQAAKLMTHANADAALVIGEDDSVDGIFTDRDLAFRVLGADLDPRRTRVSSVMTASPRCVMDDEPALAAISLMIEGGFRHLPVVDSTESVVGLLDVAKCLNDAISSVEFGQLVGGHRTVRELLDSRREEVVAAAADGSSAAPPVTIAPSCSVRAAAELLATHTGVPALLVAAASPAAGSSGACMGILTPKDLSNRVVAVGLSAARTPVEAVMTPKPAHVSEDATLLTALRLLQGSGFRHLPVLSSDGTRPLGVLDVLSLLEGALVRGDGATRTPPSRRAAVKAESATGDYAHASGAAFSPFGTPLAAGFFLFKVSVEGGERLLRLRCADDSIAALLAAVGAKLRSGRGLTTVALSGTIDDASESRPLSTDAELVDAIAAARAAGRDRLLVHATLGAPADDSSSCSASPAAVMASSVMSVRKLLEPLAVERIVAVAVVAVGVGFGAAALLGRRR